MIYRHSMRHRSSLGYLIFFLLLLQISVGIVSPQCLPADALETESNSAIWLINMAEGRTMIHSDFGRGTRYRVVALDMPGLTRAVTRRMDIPDIFPFSLTCTYRLWDLSVGCEQEAAPHSDMVARK